MAEPLLPDQDINNADWIAQDQGHPEVPTRRRQRSATTNPIVGGGPPAPGEDEENSRAIRE